MSGTDQIKHNNGLKKMRSLRALNKRTGSRKAFTLAELLIVVAIIAVLVGISIPIFLAQKEKSAEATDIANMRAAKAAAVMLYYNGIFDDPSLAAQYGLYQWTDGANTQNTNYWGIYDSNGGFFSITGNNKKFANAAQNLKLANPEDAYGAGTANDAGTEFAGYNSAYNYDDAVLVVTVYPNGFQYDAGFMKYLTAADKAKSDIPCIVLEWRRVSSKNNYAFVGRDKNKFTGQIIYLDEE